MSGKLVCEDSILNTLCCHSAILGPNLDLQGQIVCVIIHTQGGQKFLTIQVSIFEDRYKERKQIKNNFDTNKAYDAATGAKLLIWNPRV